MDYTAEELKEAVEHFQLCQMMQITSHCDIAIQALQEKAERDNPKPLTVEELEDEQPVYGFFTQRWYVISDIEKEQQENEVAYSITMTDGEQFIYDQDETFYRYPPTEPKQEGD